MKKRTVLLILAMFAVLNSTALNAQWKPVEGQMMTRWAEDVNPEMPLPEYPRPQMERAEWLNLNGLWDYAVTDKSAETSQINDGKILVPFAIESALSGVKRTFLPTEKLWYKRTFEVPTAWKGKRIILNFGAVDYISTVKVNGKVAGTHEGGNTAFSYDITDLLNPSGEQEIVVEVTDPTDRGKQPRGKQVLKPGGIYYTAVSGIWKTVWLEPVDPHYIKSYHGVPDIDRRKFIVSAEVENATGNTDIIYTAYENGSIVAQMRAKSGETVELDLPRQKLWSPEDPFLYDLTMEVRHNGMVTDKVDSYFGMRKISVGKDKDGYNRIMLNNKPIFMYGFLDQGWWPDGLLTAPTEEALVYDIQYTKDAGYNTIRKHIKVESDRFYYNCDRMGMIVWQDAVSGDNFNLKDAGMRPDHKKDEKSAEQYEYELKEMIDQLRNYPCIVNWVVFNEGWGQFGGPRLIEWTKKYDPSRLAEVSGWVDYGVGDVDDVHRYPGPGRVHNPGPKRAFAVGEFGGFGHPVQGHLWNPNMNNWGYATYQNIDEFIDVYKHAVKELHVLIGEGLSAAIYTQTTDVEGEVNGMLTYDREISKIPVEELAALHKPLYGEALKLNTIMEDATKGPQTWYYTVETPDKDWASMTEPAKGFSVGEAPFGFNHPGNVLSYSVFEKTDIAHQKNTEWKSDDIWAWREFTLDEIPENAYVRVRYDANVDVYVNGKLIESRENRVPHYYHTELIPLTEEAMESLKAGKNTIAIHANRPFREGRPDSYILDAGIYEIIE